MSHLENLKTALCQIMRDLYVEKILTDIGGNLSFRDPTNSNCLLITPSGMQKNLVKPDNLVTVSLNGEVFQDPTGLGPSIEAPMHLAIAEELQTVQCIIHSHAPNATAYSVLKFPPKIPPLTAELSILVPNVVVVPYAPSGSSELGSLVTNGLKENGIVILENHGVVAVADSFRLAAQKTRALEELIKLFYRAKRFEQFGGIIRPFPHYSLLD